MDLSAKNPNTKEEIDERTSAEIVTEIEELDKKSAEVLKKIKEFLWCGRLRL